MNRPCIENAIQLAEAVLAMCKNNQNVMGTTTSAAYGNVSESSNNRFAHLATQISARLDSLAADLSNDGVRIPRNSLESIRAIQEMVLTAALFLERLHDDLELKIIENDWSV